MTAMSIAILRGQSLEGAVGLGSLSGLLWIQFGYTCKNKECSGSWKEWVCALKRKIEVWEDKGECKWILGQFLSAGCLEEKMEDRENWSEGRARVDLEAWQQYMQCREAILFTERYCKETECWQGCRDTAPGLQPWKVGHYPEGGSW